MDLHYSQTYNRRSNKKGEFESPMDLHYSQTCALLLAVIGSLNPLWIYTTLKPQI